LVSVLFIVDPLAAVPAFLTMTEGDREERRRDMALKAAIVSTGILILFATAGSVVLRIFGVTLPAFRIAGGVILGLSALEMLRAERPSRETPGEIREGIEKPDISITPLSIPLLAGPGAISTVMVLAPANHTWRASLPVYVAILLTGFATWMLLSRSAALQKILGTTGIHVMSRLMGLVLATMAVQFILDGLRAAEVFRL
ncbi:MAG TPA: MarC family protein, partial [Verrucomicrobiae bacterium]|nr:MarC family protein [Verrucomicrobiae bacterium]